MSARLRHTPPRSQLGRPEGDAGIIAALPGIGVGRDHMYHQVSGPSTITPPYEGEDSAMFDLVGVLVWGCLGLGTILVLAGIGWAVLTVLGWVTP